MRDLVLVPGLGSDGAVWARTAAELRLDARCTIGDTLQDATLTAMAARILVAAPPRFALAGVSMGGMVALEIIRSAPDRVTHLALLDTSARPDTLGRKAYRLFANAVVSSSRDFGRVAERSLGSLVSASALSMVRAELLEMSIRVGAATYVRQNSAVLRRKDLRNILPMVAVPTAVIVGEQDRITPVARAQELHAGIAGATLNVIPGCGHLPPIEAPNKIAEILRTLLTR